MVWVDKMRTLYNVSLWDKRTVENYSLNSITVRHHNIYQHEILEKTILPLRMFCDKIVTKFQINFLSQLYSFIVVPVQQLQVNNYPIGLNNAIMTIFCRKLR